MANTIGNPLTWSIRTLGAAGHDLGAVARALGSDGAGIPEVRRIGLADLRAALRLGLADFAAMRSDVIVAALIYPIVGACLIWLALDRHLLSLAFPLLAGFALVGPAAAVGLYEMSRRREAGQAAGWSDAFAVLASPRLGAILVLGLGHLVVFVLWILTAHLIAQATLGPAAPATPGAFLAAVFTTPEGWAMMALGLPAGLVFALVVLTSSLVSFPLLLDRPVGLPVAVVTSVRVALRNPATVALWGLVVAVGLALGALPLLIGLAVVVPVLGHATWHLYRRAVV